MAGGSFNNWWRLLEVSSVTSEHVSVTGPTTNTMDTIIIRMMTYTNRESILGSILFQQ